MDWMVKWWIVCRSGCIYNVYRVQYSHISVSHFSPCILYCVSIEQKKISYFNWAWWKSFWRFTSFSLSEKVYSIRANRKLFFIYVYLYGYCCCLHSFSCVWVISNAYCSHTHFYRALFFYFFFFIIIAFSIQFLLSLPWRLVLTYTCTYSHMTRSVFIFISFHL